MSVSELFNNPAISYTNLNVKSFNAESGVIQTLVVNEMETKSLTLLEQSSVPNPAVGSQTLFIDSNNGTLTSQDSLGNSVPYLATSGGTMSGPIEFSSNVTLGTFNDASVVNSNVLVGAGSISASVENSVAIGPNVPSLHGTEHVVIGPGCQINGDSSNSSVCIGAFSQVNGNGNFNVAVGRAAIIGGGSRNVAVGLGANAGFGGGNDNISIGEAVSGVGVGVHDAIAIGNNTNNSVSDSCQIGSLDIVNIRPNNDKKCDLGSSASSFKALYLIDSQVAVGSKFSMYADVNVNNTAVETPITTGLAAGNLLYSPTLPLGTVFEFDVNLLVSSAAGDTLTLRYYSNAGLLFSHILTYAALTVNSAGNIHSMLTVRNGAIQVNSVEMVNGAVNMVTALAVVFDRTVANTFSVSAQWGLAASQLTCNQLFLKTNYRS